MCDTDVVPPTEIVFTNIKDIANFKKLRKVAEISTINSFAIKNIFHTSPDRDCLYIVPSGMARFSFSRTWIGEIQDDNEVITRQEAISKAIALSQNDPSYSTDSIARLSVAGVIGFNVE